jgi:hypothetical protein
MNNADIKFPIYFTWHKLFKGHNSILKKGQSQKSLLEGNLSYFKETICGTDSINPHRVAPNTRCDHLPGNLFL